ncbi:hypothetical protein I6F20_14160 [Bradyrhizobium sp. IC3123]|uniref:hypothetical protein n=1 Tax=Bradyrhizobium sp. IC3123 TaxID=2793803 RepID=UPI001CD41CBF|nr:hypothetical protein [Bradyrhizobium sp. IC3123]MCA1390214.1 hypothetical protein [Bradyrhizobium sp. IC3123]
MNADDARDGNGDFTIYLLNYDGSRLVDLDLGNTSNDNILFIRHHDTASICGRFGWRCSGGTLSVESNQKADSKERPRSYHCRHGYRESYSSGLDGDLLALIRGGDLGGQIPMLPPLTSDGRDEALSPKANCDAPTKMVGYYEDLTALLWQYHPLNPAF